MKTFFEKEISGLSVEHGTLPGYSGGILWPVRFTSPCPSGNPLEKMGSVDPGDLGLEGFPLALGELIGPGGLGSQLMCPDDDG